MRRLMWFTLGIGAVCALCVYRWLTIDLWIPALAMGMLSIGAALCGRKVKWLRCVAAVCLGCAAGFLWFGVFSLYYLQTVAQLDGEICYMSITATDYSYETAYGVAVEGILELNGKPVRVKTYLDEKEVPAEPDDLLKGSFRFRVTTPDGADEPTAHQGKGIFLLAYEEDAVEIQKSDETSVWTIPARLRHRLLGILDTTFPADTAGFAKALLLGDRTGIDYKTNTAFKLSGISHVIAVSGLHVTILFTLINILCFKRRSLVALLGIPTLLLFAAAAGFSPSITRVCIMQCLMILATLLNKEYDGPTELAFSCLVMLILNPLVITSVSFQLSVGCMIGIFMFSRRISEYFAQKLRRKGKLTRWVSGSVAVTLSAMAITTPLVACYFGTISLVGILTNLLTLWIISIIFYGIILVCLLSTFWYAAASLAASLIAWPIRYVLTVSKLLASFPLAAVYTASIYIVIWLIFCYILLAMFLLGKKKQPLVLFCCMVIGLCTALAASWMEFPTEETRLTALDVGQGQCILLQSDGKTFVVDCGGKDGEEVADLVAERLLSQGVFHLDGMILTHFDADHSSGAEYLLSRMKTDLLIVSDCRDDEKLQQRLTPLVSRTVTVKEDNLLSFGNTEISIFGPVVPQFDNESSLAILFQRENCDILITGDRTGFGERVLLKTARIPEVDILVAGHHGAKNASCKELLEATKPEIVVISVGENRFGHPAQETLKRFADIGSTVYRTDLHGNISIRR